MTDPSMDQPSTPPTFGTLDTCPQPGPLETAVSVFAMNDNAAHPKSSRRTRSQTASASGNPKPRSNYRTATRYGFAAPAAPSPPRFHPSAPPRSDHLCFTTTRSPRPAPMRRTQRPLHSSSNHPPSPIIQSTRPPETTPSHQTPPNTGPTIVVVGHDVITFSRLIFNPACGQLNREKKNFPCPRSRLKTTQ